MSWPVGRCLHQRCGMGRARDGGQAMNKKYIVRLTEEERGELSGLISKGKAAARKLVTLIMDNLNTHNCASFYEAFEPEEARRLTERLKIVHTPKHGPSPAEAGYGPRRRELAEHRGDRAERSIPAVSRPTHSGQGDAGAGGRGLAALPQRKTERRRLAAHHRRRPHQAQAALPTGSNVMRY